jgi:hypothetical protein
MSTESEGGVNNGGTKKKNIKGETRQKTRELEIISS